MVRDLQTPQDFRLTTAEILYHLPDEPDNLERYLWQSLDRLPDFPKLNDFLDEWRTSSDTTLHSVKVYYVNTIEPEDWDEQETSPLRN